MKRKQKYLNFHYMLCAVAGAEMSNVDFLCNIHLLFGDM